MSKYWKCDGCEREVPDYTNKCLCGRKRNTVVQSDHKCAVVGCNNPGTNTGSITGSSTWYCRGHYNSDPKITGYAYKPSKPWQDEIVEERMRSDGMGRQPNETKSNYRARCIRSIKNNLRRIGGKCSG